MPSRSEDLEAIGPAPGVVTASTDHLCHRARCVVEDRQE